MSKISELSPAAELAGDEYVALVQAGATVRGPAGALGALRTNTYIDLARGGLMGNPHACLNYALGLGGFGQLDFVGASLAGLAGAGFAVIDNSGTTGSATDQPQMAVMDTGAGTTGRQRIALATPHQTFDVGFESVTLLNAERGGIGHIEARWYGYIPEASDATNRFQVRLVLNVGATEVVLRYSDNINSGNWQLVHGAGATVLANLSIGPAAFDDGWFRLRVTPAATTGGAAQVQLWLDNWNTGAADVLFDDAVTLDGLDVAADARVMWTPEVSIIKSAGTTPRQFELAAMQVRLQAL